MTARVLHGDCVDVLAELPAASVHAVVTDPPYGLEFMGKEWDTFKPGGKRPRIGDADGSPHRRSTGTPSWAGAGNPRCRSCGGTKYDRTRPTGCSCDAPDFPNEAGAHMRAFQAWTEQWATECLRVLKPGGHLLAFGGSRTWHRLSAGVEDAGFEIRDSIAWLYGSGFPKSRNVGREAPAFVGWGTALKPGFEPVVVARKPLSGTVLANVLAHGVGALHIDATRVGDGADSEGARPASQPSSRARYAGRGGTDFAATPAARGGSSTGRWPTNVVLDEHAAAALDDQSGTLRSGVLAEHHTRAPKDAGIFGAYGSVDGGRGYGDSGGASRFFPTFRYQAKAPTAERPTYEREDGTRVAHPTVKPVELMRWLVRLVTPIDGHVLDPFAGSGATVEAALAEGFDVTAIEREADYLPLIEQRIERARRSPWQGPDLLDQLAASS